MVGMAHFRIYPFLCPRNNHPYFILVSELVCSKSVLCHVVHKKAEMQGETGRCRIDSNLLQENPWTTAASSLSIAGLLCRAQLAWAEYMEDRTVMPCGFYSVTSAASLLIF